MYQIAAIILLILFYTIYYGKQFAQKKAGITTNQVLRQEGTARTVGLLMALATLLVPVGDVVSVILNTSLLPSWARILGIAVALCGIVIFFLAVRTMGDSWRAGVSTDEKTKLITGGIYSISRNPAFLAFDLAYIGLLLLFFSWWLLAVTLFAIVMLHLQIVLVEEPFLPSAFGEEYTQYQKRVCRYLGRHRA